MATDNQKAVFKKVENKVRNGLNVRVSEEMVGIYKPSVIKKPKKLTGSKGWNELLETYLPDSLLAKKHKELLTIPRKIRQFSKGDLMTEVEELDSQAVSKGLDMGYKLKGHYKDEKGISLNINIAQILNTLENGSKTGK